MLRTYTLRALAPVVVVFACWGIIPSVAFGQPSPAESDQPDAAEGDQPESSEGDEPDSSEGADSSEGDSSEGDSSEGDSSEGGEPDHWGGDEPGDDGEPWIDTGHDEVMPPEEPVDPEPPVEGEPEPTTAGGNPHPEEGTGEAITERREPPDYDGLPDPGITAEDALLWIPRILTGPLYLITEFLIRRPVGWLVTELEQTDLLGLAAEVFTFADNKIGIFPTAFFDFGFVPSFGIYAFWSEFIFEENRLTAHAGTFGEDWLSLVVTDQVSFSDTTSLSARFSALRRPDYLLGGIGSQAQTAVQTRFGMSQVDASLDFKSRLWRRSRVRAIFGYRSATFHNEGYLGNPSVGEHLVSQGQPLPDGFTTGYSAFRLQLEGVFDTREQTPRPSAGVAVRAFANGHGAIEGLSNGFDGWLHWGGGAGGYTDIMGDDRVLALEAQVEVISVLDGDRVPFFELIDLGGLGPLAGFLPGQIRGYSMLAATLAYEWPIWVFLDGRLHFTVGNVFGDHFSDFEAEDLRMSFGVGLSPTLGGDLPFEIAFAFGTDSFANGAEITSVRFVVGARNGL